MDENRFLIELSESERTDFGKVEFAQQSDAQKVFSAVWELESQVNMDGFELYFRNSDSDIIAYAPVALKAIGATACAEIVEAALRIVSPLPSTENDRNAALDALTQEDHDTLESLSSKFYEYPDNLTALLFAHVARHPEAFGPIPN